MNDVLVESFDLSGVQIETTVTVTDIRNKKVVDEHISYFLRSACENPFKVIGFDIQFSLNDSRRGGGCLESKCANLSFCNDIQVLSFG